MVKTITLRLDDNAYKTFRAAAADDNRSISNLIETLAMKKLTEEMFVDDFEMAEIMSNKKLLEDLKIGQKEARKKRGRFVK